jgi:hypothetical protein
MAPTARCSASVQFRLRWTWQATAIQVVELKAPGEPGPNQFVSTSRGPVTERSARASVFGVSGSLRSLCFGSHGQRDGKTSSNRCRSRGRRLTWVAAGRGFAANVQTRPRLWSSCRAALQRRRALCVPKLLRLAVREPRRSFAISRTGQGAEDSSSVGGSANMFDDFPKS